MRAIILAGGRGSRLAPYTISLPKPLVDVGGVPVAEIIIRQLKRSRVERVTMAVGHLSYLLEDYFKKGEGFGLTIDYSVEKQPLGTAGPLALIDGLEGPFLVVNGDVLTTLDYSALVEYHRQSGALATIATHERSIQINLGVTETNGGNLLVGYVEKPTYRYRASMGVYVFDPRVLSYIPPGEYLDFPDLVLRLLAAGERVLTYPYEGHWLDIGSPEDYAQAGELFSRARDQFLHGEQDGMGGSVE